MSTRIDTSMISKVGWEAREGLMGANLQVHYLLPWNPEEVAIVPNDLEHATIQNLGWQHWAPLDAATPREWAGVINRTVEEKNIAHLLRLKLANQSTTIGNKTFSKKAFMTTGDPATWLIDNEGRLVPELCWNNGPVCSVRILFFEPRSLISYGWFNQQPEIGLQFVSGVCPLHKEEVGNWLIEKAVGTF